LFPQALGAAPNVVHPDRLVAVLIELGHGGLQQPTHCPLALCAQFPFLRWLDALQH
jgi:hypothetical protein